jgi:ubiquinone/menaquinone biosynthesis C-methylase UbiE
MTNDDVYAAGLLNRALDPRTQPAPIQAFLRSEIELLHETIPPGARILDVGCGTGRHLLLLAERVSLGVGLDYERSYLAEARRGSGTRPLHFVAGDATAMPLVPSFDLAICVTNTWGTMSDKAGVLAEMRRLAPAPGTRLLSVYSSESVPARREWYSRLGHAVLEETDEYLATDAGFRSEQFSESRLRSIVGACSIRPLAGIAFIVRF